MKTTRPPTRTPGGQSLSPPLYMLLALTLGLALALPAVARDPQIGDSADTVRELMGSPRGSIRSETVELLQYDRGRITLREGQVTELDLVSATEAEQRRLERQRQAEERRYQQELQREHLRLAGIEARDRALRNPDFMASSGAHQAAFWESFRRRYPDVSVESEYAAALAKRDAQWQQAENDRRLAQMEARVRDAEAQARQAQNDARQAQRDSRRRQVYYVPPYAGHRPYTAYHPQPVCPTTPRRGHPNPHTLTPVVSAPRPSGLNAPTFGASYYPWGMFGSPYVQSQSSIAPASGSGLSIRLSY